MAQELGVSTILEGAVQRAGDQVRVNVQLIDSATDAHLWAKSYDRELKDVLGVESEIAEQIAEALKANLSPSESHVLAAIRTQNTEAYDLFLRAQYEFHQAESTLAADAFDRADAFYRQTLERDPNFAGLRPGSRIAGCRDIGSSLRCRHKNYRRLSRSSIVHLLWLPIRRNPTLRLGCFFIGVIGNTMRRWRNLTARWSCNLTTL